MLYTNSYILLFAMLLLLLSCDFVSPVNRQIVLAQNLLLKHQYAEAIETYEQILKKIIPQDLRVKICYQLGELYSFERRNFNQGIFYFQEALKLSLSPEQNIKIVENLAIIYFDYLHNYRESISYYKKLVDFEPALEKHDDYEWRLAQSYLLDSRYNKANDLFQKIAKNERHHYHQEVPYSQGLLAYYQEQWPEALKFFEFYLKTEESKNKRVQAQFLMASIYELLRNNQKAKQIYQGILRDYPNEEVVKSRIKSLSERIR